MQQVALTKNYYITVSSNSSIVISEEEYDQYILDNPADGVVDYEEMFDYFEAKGHNVSTDEEAVDYENNGVEVEFL